MLWGPFPPGCPMILLRGPQRWRNYPNEKPSKGRLRALQAQGVFDRWSPSPCPCLPPSCSTGIRASQAPGNSRASSLGPCPGLTTWALPKARAAQKPPPTTKAKRRRRCCPGHRKAWARGGDQGLDLGTGEGTGGAAHREEGKGSQRPQSPRPDCSCSRSQGCFVSLWGFPWNSHK